MVGNLVESLDCREVDRPSFTHHQIVGHAVARLSDHLDQLSVRVGVLENLVGHQRESNSLAAMASSSANAMDVSFNISWQVVVDHNVDVVNV